MHSHQTLLPLPLGGVFYSVGALFNLARWPVFIPGVFAAHELFHFFVIAGSACHVFFMLKVVVPARDEPAWPACRKPRQSKKRLLAACLPRTPGGDLWQLYLPARRHARDRQMSRSRIRVHDEVNLMSPDSTVDAA